MTGLQHGASPVPNPSYSFPHMRYSLHFWEESGRTAHVDAVIEDQITEGGAG